MKKTLYILLVISSFFTVVGWGEQVVVEDTSADIPVVEELTKTTVEKEEHGIDLIELPVIEFEELQAVSNEYAHTVAPGLLTNEDVAVGQELVSEFFQLLYNHSKEDIHNESAKEKMKALLENPDRIEEFITVRESLLGQYKKVKVVDVTSAFSEIFYSDNTDNIVYNTSINLITDGEEFIQNFKVHVVKMDDALKIKGVQ